MNIIYCIVPLLTDPNSEKPGEAYIPRDENFGHLKSSDFLTYGLKSLTRSFLPALKTVFDINFTPNEFDSFEEVRALCEGGIKLPTDILSKISPLPVLKEIFRTDGESVLKFSVPDLIKGISYVKIYIYLPKDIYCIYIYATCNVKLKHLNNTFSSARKLVHC